MTQWRNRTWAAASGINAALKNITVTQKYQHFDMLYLDTPMREVLDIWIKKGGKESDLIGTFAPVTEFPPAEIVSKHSIIFPMS
jgi:hypothetical protein